MIRAIGWRAPDGGGVAHFVEVDTDEPGKPWTVCGKGRRGTPYRHPFDGIGADVGGDWRPCLDCFRRWHARRGVEVFS